MHKLNYRYSLIFGGCKKELYYGSRAIMLIKRAFSSDVFRSKTNRFGVFTCLPLIILKRYRFSYNSFFFVCQFFVFLKHVANFRREVVMSRLSGQPIRNKTLLWEKPFRQAISQSKSATLHIGFGRKKLRSMHGRQKVKDIRSSCEQCSGECLWFFYDHLNFLVTLDSRRTWEYKR